MKKGVVILLGLCVIALFIFFSAKQIKPKSTEKKDRSKFSEIVNSDSKSSTSVFVPYWSLEAGGDLSSFDSLLYFGISAKQNGIDTSDQGYLNLPKFADLSKGAKEKLLVLRMLDSATNFDILKDVRKQEKIIFQTIRTAEKYEFNGIVLNLELSALPFDSLINQINSFNERFYRSAKKTDLIYQITIYGDVYYRVRPFDVKKLSEFSDRILIMAYDMHKAAGNPGPNFPLNGKDKYGYDYSKLTDKFLADVSANKLTVIFGLYGYDWLVDDKGIAKSSGKPISLLEIQKAIISNCDLLNCLIRRDNLSAENKITYTDEDNEKHIVWYEDMESLKAKKEFLQKKGILNFGLWAYSYF